MANAHIYILLCADGSFYTGLTRRDPIERLSEHEQGLDPKSYTFRRRPLTLVYSEPFERVDEAVATERRIKLWSRAKKQALIAGDYERLKCLASRKKTRS
jgi:putative endonuclease